VTFPRTGGNFFLQRREVARLRAFDRRQKRNRDNESVPMPLLSRGDEDRLLIIDGLLPSTGVFLWRGNKR